MKLTDIHTEEKVRLDPRCWTGKKIGNPKTKMKGGVRVNNCVPAESVEEGIFGNMFGGTAKTKPGQLRPYEEYDGFMIYYDPEPQLFVTVGTGEYKGKFKAKGFEDTGNAAFYGEQMTGGKRQNPIRTFPRAAADHMTYNEDYNAEYDDEAGMADNNLETLARAVQGIDDLIQSGDNLPEWCQEKIAVAKSMLVAVWDYMYSEEASDEVDPEIDAMFEAMQDLVSEMSQKNRVSEDLVWETFEALPDNVLYETAAWRRKEGKSKKGGLNAKGVASYRRENPGSKLQTAVTTKPSKLKPGSKAAKRRKSFCARMGGVKGPMKKPNGKPTRKALALRKWNC